MIIKAVDPVVHLHICATSKALSYYYAIYYYSSNIPHKFQTYFYIYRIQNIFFQIIYTSMSPNKYFVIIKVMYNIHGLLLLDQQLAILRFPSCCNVTYTELYVGCLTHILLLNYKCIFFVLNLLFEIQYFFLISYSTATWSSVTTCLYHSY